MCDPVTIAIVASTAVAGYGQIQAGKAASAQAKYQAQVAQNNQTIAQQNSEAALDKGRADAEDKRRETAQRAGLQRAQLAAQGFDVSEGTSIDILADTAELGELDVLRIESDAQQRSRNFLIQGDNFQAESDLQLLSGKNAKKAGQIGAFSTLLGGAGKAGQSYIDNKG